MDLDIGSAAGNGGELRVSDIGRGRYTIAEIVHQPKAWQEVVELIDGQREKLVGLVRGIDEVVFTGCGSAYNASLTLASTFQHVTGLRARAVTAAELYLFPETAFVAKSKYLVVALSRSGETTETVKACNVAKERDCRILCLTCWRHSRLERLADVAVILDMANERSMVATQSVTAMMLAMQLLAGQITGEDEYLSQLRELPSWGEKIVVKSLPLAEAIGRDKGITKFAFVGSGSYFGLARESQLMTREVTLHPSDAYPIMDFRHGPQSYVDESMLITVLLSDRGRHEEIQFIREMKGLGAKIYVICEEAGVEVESLVDHVTALESRLPDFVRSILYLPPIQLMAYYSSLSRGQDPDNPRNSTYWVDTSAR